MPASGAATWTSDPATPDVEVDVFAGFAGGDAAESFGYDVGVIYYAYPSASTTSTTVELYAGISKGWFAGKLWYSPDIASSGSSDACYVEGNATIPLPRNFSLLAHVGYSFGELLGRPLKDTDYSTGRGLCPFGNFDLAAEVGRR